MPDELIYENDDLSTAYYAVDNVTITNHPKNERYLSICQGCGLIRARAYEHDEHDECSATTNTEGDEANWVFGEHVWNHVNEIYVVIDHTT